ncbi:MAG: hypothetical protein DMF51_12120, partial [Acidobacteria bacterium]
MRGLSRAGRGPRQGGRRPEEGDHLRDHRPVLLLHHPGRVRHLPRPGERSPLQHREGSAAGAASTGDRAGRGALRRPVSPPSRSDGPLPAYLAAGACTLIWGSNYSIAKRLLLEVDPLAVAWVRAAAGVLFFGLLLALRDGRGGLVDGLRRAAPLGLLGIFANQILFMTGLRRTSAAHSAILIALLPVFVLLISALGRAERISVPKIAGVMVAFGGATVIGLEHGVGLEAASATGDLLTLAGVLAFAGYTVL